MAAEGADLIDVGGESTRPGRRSRCALDEELRRVMPVIERLAPAARSPLSIDTSRPRSRARRSGRGASFVNDVTALRGDPDDGRRGRRVGRRRLPDAHAGRAAHDAGRSALRRRRVRGEGLPRGAARASRSAQGIAEERVWLDPGIGFGKTLEHNLELIRRLGRDRRRSGGPVLVGASRKRFIGALTGRPERERVAGTRGGQRARLRARRHDVPGPRRRAPPGMPWRWPLLLCS